LFFEQVQRVNQQHQNVANIQQYRPTRYFNIPHPNNQPAAGCRSNAEVQFIKQNSIPYHFTLNNNKQCID